MLCLATFSVKEDCDAAALMSHVSVTWVVGMVAPGTVMTVA
jgi:hypothetical protein